MMPSPKLPKWMGEIGWRTVVGAVLDKILGRHSQTSVTDWRPAPEDQTRAP